MSLVSNVVGVFALTADAVVLTGVVVCLAESKNQIGVSWVDWIALRFVGFAALVSMPFIYWYTK